MPLSQESQLMSNINGLHFSVRASGHGFELLDAGGKVIAWTLDQEFALRILLALELQAEEVPLSCSKIIKICIEHQITH